MKKWLKALRNTGTGTEVIRWGDSKVLAAPIQKRDDGSVTLGEIPQGQYYRIDVDQIFTTIAAGQIEHHSLLLSVNASGIYFIDAQLVGSPGASAESMEEAKAAGVVAESVIWGGTTYTTVSLEQISGIA